MAGKSWEFAGETKDWDNFWEHKFIRTQLVTGWSAQEGGPGASSHQREERTQTYLRRPCVMNPSGGPQGVPATDIHAEIAGRSLALVDAKRREEFHRRKGLAEINEGLKKLEYIKDVQQNLGYPFNKGMEPRKIEKKQKDETPEEIKQRERAEIMAQLHPKPETADFDKEWDREIIGKIMWKDTTGHSKDNSSCTCTFNDTGELTEKGTDCPVQDVPEEEKKHFHSWQPWIGLPIGWQDGYLEFRDVGANPPVRLKSEKAKPETTDLVVAEEEGGAAPEKQETLSQTGSGRAGSTLSRTGSKDTGVMSKTGSKEGAEEEEDTKPRYAPKPDGHCKHCKKLLASHSGPEQYCYAGTWVMWHGPEEDPKWLDTFVWKPLNSIGPGLIKSIGADTTARNLELGRPTDLPRELLPKRSYLREETHYDALKGRAKTVKYKAHVAFDNNIHTTDWLTGMTTYKFDQQERTKTNAMGHGTLDKKELIRRKEAKAKQVEKAIAEFVKSIGKQENLVKKAEDAAFAQLMTVGTARNKIEAAEKLIAELQKQQGYLEIRLEQEKREIKALKHELEVMHIARDLPVPKSLVLAMHPKQLSSIADFNYGLNPIREAVGVPAIKEEIDEIYESCSEDEDGLNVIGLFFKGKGRQNKGDFKHGEKYFGQPLVVPATGVLNIPVVNRKNADVVLKSKEEAKAMADVYMARSRGKPLLPRPNLDQRKAEKLARIEQQGKVDVLLGEVFKTDPAQDLEAWAKSQARRFSVFGSSMYPAAKPEMETVPKIIIDPRHGMPTDEASWQTSVFELNVDGNCKKCGKAQSNHRGDDPKFCYDTHYRRVKKGESSGNKITRGCTSGKAMGSTAASLTQSTNAVKAQLGRATPFHTAFQITNDSGKFELKDWGPERGDQWAIGTAFSDAFGKQCRSAEAGITPNVSMTGGLEPEKMDARKGPYADTIVEDRAFNGAMHRKKRA